MFIPCDLKPVPLADVISFRERGWIVEEKYDGIRAILHCGRVPFATGKRWDGCAPATIKADSICKGLHAELNGMTFDGELMSDGRYFVFDLITWKGDDVRDLNLSMRKSHLNSVTEFMPENFSIVRSFGSTQDLGQFGEGIVIKRLDAKYGFDWFKAKRTETLDVIVKKNFGNGVAEVESRGKVVGVPFHVSEGQTIEVKAFKVFDSGKLRNGEFVRVRDDK